MTERVLAPLTVVSAVGSGIVGGVFFAFSVFVMRALDGLPPAQGLQAMQGINRWAPTGWFMTALLGTALTCAVLGVSAALDLDRPGAALRLVGSVLYLVAIVVTIFYHVPRNDALAGVSPDGVDAARRWAEYLPGWTAWNHVRTITSIAAAATLTVAARVVEQAR
ncbi:DUF1772 domain-containing protein [Parafrankia sp. BMG5.11]|uniref:anthrone oxygenase family protein n=1 Tax=Parafrankia sp. BMG5.11 TaxID=222540 RepID=UPI00103D4512|nr:anthrone oxygenase family protein [Parafrankia sp. BMG5.11]TCJ30137.1 DUF1772 domain-containing protein [Parafrankia sp. BMG5.11]CAI7973531.1 DUF1772 domain-containing protein [Frankia sp. Hr75.2]